MLNESYTFMFLKINFICSKHDKVVKTLINFTLERIAKSERNIVFL